MHIAILCISAVAICTGRVEAKSVVLYIGRVPCPLQSARGVWRQSSSSSAPPHSTMLQSARGVWRQSVGAAALSRMPPLQSARGVWRQRNQERMVLPCIRRLQSARGVWRQRRLSDSLLHSGTLLQSARGVWRQSEKVAGARREITRCNLHGACRETERHHPPKKSEKIYADLLHFYSF